MIEYAFVPAHTIMGEGVEMLPRHAEDAAYGEKANLDWDYYLEASIAGQCYASTVRDNGKLVGYSVYFLSTQTNHKHIIEASNSVLFIEKKYRGRAFFKLLDVAEEALKKMGAHEINYLLKNPQLGKLLARRGYKPDHTLWSIKI